jgi:myo-inositol 2-dehydrogenase / D-chiro-inositol 1-dehydrogenase
LVELPLRVGLVGCGLIGQIHADGLRLLVEDGVVSAVGAADPSESARKAALHNCPFAYATADPHEVIADPGIDAVLIASPTHTHGELVRAALGARKPLLCEKPLAQSFSEVRDLARAVAASGITAQVGFHQRFHPIVDRLHQTVASGEFGKAMGYTLREDQFWPTGDVVPGHSSWRSKRALAGGGALLEHSIHAADVLCSLFGAPRRVFAVKRSVFGYDVEDVAALTVEHETGVVGTLLTVFNGVQGREVRRLEVFFERGVVETTSDFIVGAEEDGFLVQRPGEPPEQLDLEELREKRFTALEIPRRDFLFYTYVADRIWARSVVEQLDASPGFEDALRAHALVEAAYRSAATGSTTDVGEMFDLA